MVPRSLQPSICIVLLSVAWLAPARAEQPVFLSTPEWVKNIPALKARPAQVVVIQAQGGVRAAVSLWKHDGVAWALQDGPWPAVIGKNGIAPLGQKKEGDGKTPAGLFSISSAFGESEQFRGTLPYRATTDRDIWVDDAQSPLYNQRSQLPTPARSYEKMKRKDMLYRLGLVVDYNRDPVVAGAGSAIFIHIWRNQSKGTAGCAALAEEHLRKLALSLNAADHPAALFLP